MQRLITLKDDIARLSETEPRFPQLEDSLLNKDLIVQRYFTLKYRNIMLHSKRDLSFGLFAARNGFKANLNFSEINFLWRVMAHFPICSLHVSQERLSIVELNMQDKSKFSILKQNFSFKRR